ncbi:MAG: hypothetical protein Q7J57_15325, partial [Gemmobacter sp.]|nr:hypothetical protein [Gemmobacter sp.]
FVAQSGFKVINAEGHVRLVRDPTVGSIAAARRLEAINQITQSRGDRAALKELANFGDEAALCWRQRRSGCR